MSFIDNYKRYGSVPSSHDIIKCFALIIMVVDHIGAYFFPDDLMWRAIGRICVPIWLFLAGYAKPGKMGKEIIVLSVVLIIADMTTNRTFFPVNILFTIIFCRLFADYFHKIAEKNLELAILLPFLVLMFFITGDFFEYGTLAFIFAAWGYLHRNESDRIRTKIIAIFVTFTFIVLQILFFELSLFESFVMAFGLGIVAYFLQSFKTVFYPSIEGKIYSKIIMFLARNTLYIYVLHLIIFKIIAFFIFPEQYTEYTIFITDDNYE